MKPIAFVAIRPGTQGENRTVVAGAAAVYYCMVWSVSVPALHLYFGILYNN